MPIRLGDIIKFRSTYRYAADWNGEFFVIDNSGGEKDVKGNKVIKELPDLPEDALTLDGEALYGSATQVIQDRRDQLQDYVVRGGEIGSRLWGKPQKKEPEPVEAETGGKG